MQTNSVLGLSTGSFSSFHLHLQRRHRRTLWSLHCVQQQHQVRVRVGKHGMTRCVTQPKTPINMWIMNKHGVTLHSETPEWLQEFRENLVDERVPECRDSHASSSHESSLELARSADLGQHSVHSHFPRDRNFEICQRTKITRAPCRRRNGDAVPRAESFGDLITADHNIPSEGCESRHNHLCAVVVQDVTIHWVQSYQCKTEAYQETGRSLQKFLER